MRSENPKIVKARQEVVCAVLYQAYAVEYDGDRGTSEASADLDYASDRLDEAFEAYATAIRQERPVEAPMEATWEWIVTHDAEGDGHVIYRGTDESYARILFNGIVPHRGWGGTLQRRQIGPTEDVEVKR